MNKGILSGIVAYSIWGFFPIYWKAIHEVPPLQVVGHRLVWSLVFLAAIIAVRRDWAGFRAAFTRRTVLIYAVAAAILTVNWLMYVWGVNAGFVVETSLGYFINPLVNVLLGVIFFHERLTVSKWVPIGLAAAGVAVITVSFGALPWLALALAFSFGIYGLFKKAAPLGALHGLALETSILFVPSVAYLLFVEANGTGSFGHISPLITVLLMFAGVATAAPLLLFSDAARRIPLSTLGLLQYIAPTVQFFLGVFVYGEELTAGRMIGFSLIWLGLIIYSFGSMLSQRRKAVAAV